MSGEFWVDSAKEWVDFAHARLFSARDVPTFVVGTDGTPKTSFSIFLNEWKFANFAASKFRFGNVSGASGIRIGTALTFLTLSPILHNDS